MAHRLATVGVLAALLGCAPESNDDVGSDGEAIEMQWPHLSCDPLVPLHCGLPFPSNVFTDAADTETGRRVALSALAMPISYYGLPVEAGPFNGGDGFPAGLGLMAHLPGATVAGLASPQTIERSLQDDSPTVVIDAQTGRRVPHFAELDMTHDDDERRVFIVRPVERLEDGTRYIVAIRKVEDASGATVAPSTVFEALRDRSEHADPSVASRGALYDDIFARLQDAGVQREDLQLAWDFTTSSTHDNTHRLLTMRDVAMQIVGEDGPEYTITSVTDNPEEGGLRRLDGTFRVPLFLDQPGPGARLLLREDGSPHRNPEIPWADYDFKVWIPNSAADTPAGLAQFGHGLFSDAREPMWFEMPFSNDHNFVVFAVDWIGFSGEADQLHIAGLIDSGNFGDFVTATDRLHQGVLNHLLAMRMMSGRFVDEPLVQFNGHSAIDPTQRYYYGSSQGGIMGAVYMAASTDVTRGMLDTTGQPYNLLLPRSAAFDDFFEIVRAVYPDPVDIMMLLAFAQIPWERIEPSGWSHHIRQPLPGTPKHEVLIRPAVGDHQVTNLGAHIMARAVDAVMLDTGVRSVWGLPTVGGPHEGSALVEYDFGIPADPVVNVPNRQCRDPHDQLRRIPEGQQQLARFFRDGAIANTCPAGVCSFPDLSGCE